jgi:hypothetical protein
VLAEEEKEEEEEAEEAEVVDETGVGIRRFSRFDDLLQEV